MTGRETTAPIVLHIKPWWHYECLRLLLPWRIRRRWIETPTARERT